MYSISDLATEFGVTTRTLRFYEEKGLLNPERVKTSRSYSKADRARLKLILRGKRIGLSLQESEEIIGLYDRTGGSEKQVAILLEKIAEKRAQLLAQKRDIEDMLAALDQVEAKCT